MGIARGCTTLNCRHHVDGTDFAADVPVCPGCGGDLVPIDVANEEPVEFEIPPVTAPTLPTEHVLLNAATFYQRTIGGGMDVKFVPLVATPNGNVPAPEATVIRFGDEGWAKFKREVERDGELAPVIETARVFPGGLLNGDGG